MFPLVLGEVASIAFKNNLTQKQRLKSKSFKNIAAQQNIEYSCKQKMGGMAFLQ